MTRSGRVRIILDDSKTPITLHESHIKPQ